MSREELKAALDNFIALSGVDPKKLKPKRYKIKPRRAKARYTSKEYRAWRCVLDGLTHAALGSLMAEQLYQTANRSGFMRKFLERTQPHLVVQKTPAQLEAERKRAYEMAFAKEFALDCAALHRQLVRPYQRHSRYRISPAAHAAYYSKTSSRPELHLIEAAFITPDAHALYEALYMEYAL